MFIWYHHYCYCTIHPFCSPAPPPPRWSSWRTRRLFIELFTISRFSLSIAMRSAVLPVKGVTSTNEIALDPPPYPRLRNLCTTPFEYNRNPFRYWVERQWESKHKVFMFNLHKNRFSTTFDTAHVKFSLLFRMTNLNFKLENLPRGSTQSMLIAPDSREFCSILRKNLGFEFQNGKGVLYSFLIKYFHSSKTFLLEMWMIMMAIMTMK